MLEKHLKRIKKSESGVAEEDEWEEIPTLGQKIQDQIIEEVPDRSITIEKIKKSNYEQYEKNAAEIKDQFSNTAQFINLIKNQVNDKKIDFEKFQKDSERFNKEISFLKPQKNEFKFDLSKLDYKEIRVSKLKHELQELELEREEIKSRITHFNTQIIQAQTELNFKVEQIDDIKMELLRLQKKEALQNEIKTEQEAIDLIKNELSVIGDINESKKIYRTVNTLVELLNSKNKATMNELNAVRIQFNELKKKYDELMSKLK